MATFTIYVTSTFDFGIGSNSLKNPKVRFNTYLQMFFECKFLKIFATLALLFAPSCQSFFKLKILDDIVKFLRQAEWSEVQYR
jgi:hypothetical protein